MPTLLRRGLVLLTVLAVFGLLLAPKLRPLYSDTADAPEPTSSPEPEPLAVWVHEVVPGRLAERLTATGTIRANEQVELVSEIAGKVEAIHFEEGQPVAADQLLLEIDASELEAERQRTGYQVELAARREARQRELLDDGVISEQEHDFVANELNVLRAELRRVEAQLVKASIRAPFAGTVGLRQVSVGGYLTPQTAIATLQDLDPVKLDFAIPEKYAGQVRVGREVVFRVAGSTAEHRGEVYAIEPRVDPQTRSLLLRARSSNADGSLLPGIFADVELAVREVEDALTVPSVAVIPELGGKKVFVVEEGEARSRGVETGVRGAERVEVTAGLEAGDRVIVTGIQQLRAGMPVRVEGSVAD